MDYIDQYLKAKKVFSLRFHLALLKKKKLSQEFSLTECGAKLVTVTNQTSSKTSNCFICIFSGKLFFLFNQFKIQTVRDLVKNLKSERLCYKIFVSERFGRGKWGLTQTQENNKLFRKEMNEIMLILLCFHKSKFRNSFVKFLLV